MMTDTQIHAMLPLTMEEAYAIELGHQRALARENPAHVLSVLKEEDDDLPKQ